MQMGIIDFEFEEYHLKRITSTLKRRGLAPEIEGEGWEVHGPHPGFNNQMYVGWAYYLDNPKEFIYVNIMPRAVYAVDPDDNNIQHTQENRIPIV